MPRHAKHFPERHFVARDIIFVRELVRLLDSVTCVVQGELFGIERRNTT